LNSNLFPIGSRSCLELSLDFSKSLISTRAFLGEFVIFKYSSYTKQTYIKTNKSLASLLLIISIYFSLQTSFFVSLSPPGDSLRYNSFLGPSWGSLSPSGKNLVKIYKWWNAKTLLYLQRNARISISEAYIIHIVL